MSMITQADQILIVAYSVSHRCKHYTDGAIGGGKKTPQTFGEILPSAFGVEQYFPDFEETISNNDLNASHYLYNSSHGTFCPLKLVYEAFLDYRDYKTEINGLFFQERKWQKAQIRPVLMALRTTGDVILK